MLVKSIWKSKAASSGTAERSMCTTMVRRDSSAALPAVKIEVPLLHELLHILDPLSHMHTSATLMLPSSFASSFVTVTTASTSSPARRRHPRWQQPLGWHSRNHRNLVWKKKDRWWIESQGFPGWGDHTPRRGVDCDRRRLIATIVSFFVKTLVIVWFEKNQVGSPRERCNVRDEDDVYEF